MVSYMLFLKEETKATFLSFSSTKIGAKQGLTPTNGAMAKLFLFTNQALSQVF